MFIVLLASYLLGSVNSAIIVSRVLYHDDIRKHGSGN
ncbi:MAG: glycerol-3-phosphate acyltransferase, partial [Clostridia bacterium]|nr:glycerol-3-phosphate acyltransferase [Clostridia bacterium]